MVKFNPPWEGPPVELGKGTEGEWKVSFISSNSVLVWASTAEEAIEIAKEIEIGTIASRFSAERWEYGKRA